MSASWNLPWSASCLCGQVQMTITMPPLSIWACHCLGCQKLTAGPYSLTMLLPRAGFTATGETEQGGLHGPNDMRFCTHCKNWLWNSPPGSSDLVCLRATMLDDASWVTPWAESWTETKLPGVVSGAKVSFPRYAPEAQYPGMIADFNRYGARPPS